MLEMLLLALGACQPHRGGAEGLPAEVKAQIGKAKTQELAPCSVSAIPEPVRRVLADQVHERELKMADPGQQWNSSDLGSGGMPRQMLERATHNDRVWVVDFWRGGFASTYRVVVIGFEQEEAKLLWAGKCHGGGIAGKGKWKCEALAR